MKVPEAFHKESFINRLCTFTLTYMVLFPASFVLIDFAENEFKFVATVLTVDPCNVRCTS
jgi:hypothetical protein